MNILIIGFGFVGKATYLLNNKDINIFVYDINLELCIPLEIVLEEYIKKVDLIFISLPTPLNIDGTCYTKLIDDVLKKIDHEYIIIRSTVPIGYCDSKNVFFMPEFLTEKKWKEDFINNKHWIFGMYDNCSPSKKSIFMNRITDLINLSYTNRSINYNDIIFCTNKEAELTKLVKNTFLATKVSYFNEIYDLTEKLNINYNRVIELVKSDERIGDTHMACPGHDGKKGYGGTCFPKDTNSMYYQMVGHGIDTHIFEANLYRNEIIDRPERDWLRDKGRTNIDEKKFKIILVTSGSGILGRKLCKKLLEDFSNKIICLYNFLDLENDDFKLLLNNPNFKILSFNIIKKIFLPHVDEIYHLTPVEYFKFCESEPIETAMFNFQGTKNIIDLAKVHNAKVLLTSIKDDNDISIYTQSIALAETLMCEYRNKYKIDTKTIKILDTNDSVIERVITMMKSN